MLQLVPASSGNLMHKEWQCFSLANETSNPNIEVLLEQYLDLFQEPKGLPPSRGVFDHRIPLQPGANPVNIIPYRYPLKQKDIIEKLVQEMLDCGIIQPSYSPFASRVV